MSKLASFSNRAGSFSTTPLERVNSSSVSLAKVADPEVQQLVAPSQVYSSAADCTTLKPPRFFERTRQTMAYSQPLSVYQTQPLKPRCCCCLGSKTDTYMPLLFVSLLMLFSACRSASGALILMPSTQQPTAAPWQRWPSLV